MFIQEVIVDGFKSYAHRTVIEGFDPHFNAITGLNGSGKSNILDSICFVLGITNLSQVRAGNLSELVYKQGQAGVNKATVTIVFNNEDEANSPVGYEQCSEVTVTRQVLLGGKSKYLINGRNAPAGQVQNLFHSVQLNVNNPHFLIMQGRITKVLNMKPNEILGMVEEAAGTRMYETKRLAALKTIDKKQLKLDELNSVLAEEITPTLERLRGEKQNYLKWSKNNADIERLERYVVASQFVKAQQALEDNSDGFTEMEEKVERLEKEADKVKKRIADKEDEIKARAAKLRGEFEESHNETKKNEQKLSNDLVRVTSVWKNTKDNVFKAEGDVEAAHSLVKETKDSVSAKEKEIQDESKSIDGIRQAAKEAEARVTRVTAEYQNMSAGISSGEGDEGRTLPEQISRAHSDSKTAEAKVEQARMKISHLSKQLKAVEKDIKKEGKSSEKLAAKCEASSKKVADLKAEIEQLGFLESDFSAMEQEKSDLDAAIAELSEQVDTLSAQLAGRLSFKYSDPVRGFDRSKVKGLVAKLVEVRDSKHSTALEVVAGGKLFQVVVDEAITGKALLDRGNLARRVTIIPLDKIKPRQISDTTSKSAASIASSLKSTALPAIELVGFEEEVRSAIEYVFGSTIVVDGMKAANQICDATKTRTVTLEGDVYDPSGTISGGSKNQLGTTLAKLSELTEAKRQLDEKQTKSDELERKISSQKSGAARFEKLSAKLELASAELQATEKHMSQTRFGVLVEQRESMTKEINAAEGECIEMEQEKTAKWALYEQLKDKKDELTQQREQRFASIEQEIQDAKTKAHEKAQQAREAESRYQTLVLELESLKAELAAAEDAHSVAAQVLEDALDQESQTQMEVGETQALYEEARSKLDAIEKDMASCSSEVVALKREKDDLVEEAEATMLEAKKLSVNISRVKKERAGAEKAVAAMLKKYAWIESEKSAFGVAGGDYDFEATNPNAAERQLTELKGEQDALTKTINKKVMGMIEKAEGEYTELLRKRKVVENDKKKIQNVIEELDVKKKSELQRTWVKVNRDFGSIFSTLLPGASAKLEPPDGMQAWEGLEVKVAFGDVWKESLSELSGGQRSLLALSLILSLLLFKPAPMYILDEVDAALDLSHTQNIGNMLKTHFSQSQFIVVSLKEGMFNNANVIFRTKFVDGVSTVTRTIGTGSSRARTLAEAANTGDSVPFTMEKPTAAARAVRRKGKENTSR